MYLAATYMINSTSILLLVFSYYATTKRTSVQKSRELLMRAEQQERNE